MEFRKVLLHGLWRDLPPFRLVLGLCPSLAVTSSAENGLGMGLAVTFVLIFSNLFISILRKVIPDKVRIASYIVIIATLVVIVEMIMKAFFFPLSQQLGIYIPLIVVNCIILGRAEAFASRNGMILSMTDGLSVGIGFTMSPTGKSTVRPPPAREYLALISRVGKKRALASLSPALLFSREKSRCLRARLLSSPSSRR